MVVSLYPDDSEKQSSVVLTIGGKLPDEDLVAGSTEYNMSRKETYTRKSFDIAKKKDQSAVVATMTKDKGIASFKTLNHTWKISR